MSEEFKPFCQNCRNTDCIAIYQSDDNIATKHCECSFTITRDGIKLTTPKCYSFLKEFKRQLL